MCRLGFWTVGCVAKVQSRRRVVGPIGSRRHASPGRDPGARWIPAWSRRLRSGVLAGRPIAGVTLAPPECVSDRRRAASKPRTRVTRYLCIPDGAKSPENALERPRAIGCRVRLRSRTRHPSRTAHPGPDPAHCWDHRTNPPGAGPSAVVRHEPHQARYAAVH